MSVTISGTVDYPDPITTHDDPQTTQIDAGTLLPGVTTQYTINGFKNTGNVPQTLSVTVSDVIGVVIVGVSIEVGGSQYSNQAVVNPGYSPVVRVNVRSAKNTITPDEPFSLTVNPTWTYNPAV